MSGCPPNTQAVEVLGTRVFVTRKGHGVPILCLHAAGHSGRDFLCLSERLCERFEFIMIDWPGHGQSPPEAIPASAQRYADLLASIVNGLRLQRFLILANSIGGAAAIIYVAKHPNTVTGMILCNPAGLQPVGLLARLVCRRMAAFFSRGASGGLEFQRKFRRYYEREVLREPSAAWRRQEIIASAGAVAPILREAWESFAGPAADIRHSAPKIQCPVLFAWARGDKYVAWSRSRRAALSVPRHAVQFFEGGHAAFLEQPAAFEKALISFADSLSACRIEMTTEGTVA